MIKIEWQEMPPRKGMETREKRLFPRMKDNGSIGLDELIEVAAKRSKLSKGTFIAVYYDLQEAIAQQLAEGKMVELPDLGTLRLSIGTDAEVTSTTHRRMDKVKVQGVLFQPSDAMMQSIGQPRFEWSPDPTLQHAPSAEELIGPLTEYFAEHESITRAEFSRLFRLKRTTSISRLKELARMGVVQPQGQNRETVYVKDGE